MGRITASTIGGVGLYQSFSKFLIRGEAAEAIKAASGAANSMTGGGCQ